MRQFTQKYGQGSKSIPPTPSSDGKSALRELLTCKDTSNFADGVLSALFGIVSTQQLILSQQGDLFRQITNIVQRMDRLENMVQGLQLTNLEWLDRQETRWPKDTVNCNENTEDWMGFINSLKSSPEPTISVDITCDETFLSDIHVSLEKPSRSNGYGEDLE